MPAEIIKKWCSSGHYAFNGEIDYNELRKHNNITDNEPLDLFRGIHRVQELDTIVMSNPECDIIRIGQLISYCHDRPYSWTESKDIAMAFSPHVKEQQYGHPMAFGMVLHRTIDHTDMMIDLRLINNKEDEIIVDTNTPRTAKIHQLNQNGKLVDFVSLADLRDKRSEYLRDML
jgi:hypothetical protein